LVKHFDSHDGSADKRRSDREFSAEFLIARLGSMFSRLLNVFRRRHLDNQLRQEFETHLAAIEEEELARGATPEDARRTARLRFGNPSLYQESTRDADLVRWLDDWWRDLKIASRQVWRSPTFAVSAVLLLGFGIGVNAAIFTVISSVILRPIPLPESDRLVSILAQAGKFETPMSFPDLLDLQNGNHVFASSGGFRRSNFVFRGGQEALNIKGANVTPDYFSTLRIQPIAGRVFDASEGTDAGTLVAILREDFWKTALNADPEILQKTILVNGQATQVVGILPTAFRFPASDTVIWMPLVPMGPQRGRGWHAFSMVGRLKPSVTLAQAQADLQAIMLRLEQEYPEQNSGRTAKVVSFQEWSIDKQLRDRLLALQIAAFALFLMACANVSNLLIARYSTRRAEFEIRRALGASPLSQIRQHLTESLLLTGIGCIVAAALTWLGVRFLVWIYGEQMPRSAEISPNWRLVIAVIGAAIGGSLIVGLATALHERRKTAGIFVGSGSRISAHRTSIWTRKALVAFQLICAVVLLTATGDVLRRFWDLLHVDIGFDRSHLITMRVNLPSTRYTTGAQIGEWFENLMSSIRSVPGVQQAAAVNMLPVAEWGFNGNVGVEGMADEHQWFFAEYRWVTQGYLRTFGIPLQRGRQFLPEEISGKQKAAIINETMSRQLWGDRDPIGAHIRILSPEWITVVGISPDVRQSGVSSRPSAEVYLPAAGFVGALPSWSVVVRSDLAAESVLPAIRGAVRAMEPEAALDRTKTMDEIVADSLSAQRIVGGLLASFAVLALVIAALGLYGLIAFMVVARLPELAIRSVLGSSPIALLGLVSREGVRLMAAGLAIGFAAVVPLRPLLARFVFDVGQANVTVFFSVFFLLIAVGSAASAVPLLRAVRIDPIRILRRE
jgi:putative ABC transport system permease protein